VRINLLGWGVIVRKDSAFSSMVKLDNGNLICSFSRSGGPEVISGIHRTRSVDQEITWQYEGVIQPSEECDGNREVNTLRT